MTASGAHVEGGPSAPRPLRRRSVARQRPAAERVATAIRSAIIDGAIPSGTQINQQSWADQLNVSRAALREGLKALSAEKLLDHEEHRGFFAIALDTAQMREIYWLRIEIERQLLQSCRVPDEREAMALTALCQEILRAIDDDVTARRHDAERKFFAAIYELSPHRFLGGEAMRLWDLAESCRSMMSAIAASTPLSGQRLRDRRLSQLEAVLSGDRFGLSESVLTERRAVADALMSAESSPLKDPPVPAEVTLLL